MRTLTFALAMAAAVAPQPIQAAVPAESAQPAVHRLQLNPEAEMPVYGTFRVFWKSGAGGWKQAGELGYDNFYRERTLDLRGSVPAGASVTLRLVQVGGGASQLDGVRLGGQAPLGLAPAQEKKLAAADRDVVVASGKTFDFHFGPVAAPVLKLAARVEAPKIPHTQFNLPEANRMRGPETGWSFMPYALGSQPLRLRPDGELDEVKGLRPFLHEIRTSATGHGFGDVYAWVGDDADHLYVAFDFTIDNTVEDDFYPGADDYAKVYIRYGPGKTDLQEFKLRVRDSKWGKTGFAYTDKVGYEHRTYEFRIPRAQIKALRGAEKKNLALAFGLFGSASDGDYPVRIVYAPGRQRYLALSGYAQAFNTGEYVHARLLGADGATIGSKFAVTGPTYANSTNAYSFDAAWDPQNDRFVVIWHQQDGLMRGRHLYADGTSGPAFTLATGLGTGGGELDLARGGNATWPFLAAVRSNVDGAIYVLPFKANGVTAGTFTAIPKLNAGWAIEPRVAASADGSYVLAWNEDYNIHAAHVGADGSLYADPITVYDGAGYELAQSLAYDTERGRFLIAWRSDSNDNVSAAAFYPGANTASAVFQLFNAGAAFRYPRPALDWDALRKQYPLVMHLTNDTVPLRYAEIDAGDFGFAFGPVTTAALSQNNVSPTVVAAGDSGAALLAWQTYANGVCCVLDYAVAVTNLPVATLSGGALDFGTVTIDATAVRELVISNTGAARSLMAVQAAIDGPFTITTNGCTGSTLAKGASCSIFVTAKPTAEGAKTGTLRLTGGLAKNVTLTVTGAVDGVPGLVLTDPAPPATDGELAFGYVQRGTKLVVRTVTVTNEGTADLKLGAIAAPQKGGAFTLDAAACSGKTLAPGKRCAIEVTFAPAADQAYEANVEIPSNDPDGAATLSLRGTGVPAGGIAELTAPVLVAPANGAADVEVPAELVYRKALASDGGAVKHTVFVCEDATFVTCEGETVALAPLGGRWGWLAFGAGALGFVFFRRKSGAAAVLLAGLTFVSCGDGKSAATESTVGLVTYVAEDLEAKTVYYWKVVAEDAAGRVTQSEARSFTTK